MQRFIKFEYVTKDQCNILVSSSEIIEQRCLFASAQKGLFVFDVGESDSATFMGQNWKWVFSQLFSDNHITKPLSSSEILTYFYKSLSGCFVLSNEDKNIWFDQKIENRMDCLLDQILSFKNKHPERAENILQFLKFQRDESFLNSEILCNEIEERHIHGLIKIRLEKYKRLKDGSELEALNYNYFLEWLCYGFTRYSVHSSNALMSKLVFLTYDYSRNQILNLLRVNVFYSIDYLIIKHHLPYQMNSSGNYKIFNFDENSLDNMSKEDLDRFTTSDVTPASVFDLEKRYQLKGFSALQNASISSAHNAGNPTIFKLYKYQMFRES